jgi:hypothetical protein
MRAGNVAVACRARYTPCAHWPLAHSVNWFLWVVLVRTHIGLVYIYIYEFNRDLYSHVRVRRCLCVTTHSSLALRAIVVFELWGCTWHCWMRACVCVCVCVVETCHGFLFVELPEYEGRNSAGPYGPIWAFMGPRGPLWAYRPHVLLWAKRAHMGHHGPKDHFKRKTWHNSTRMQAPTWWNFSSEPKGFKHELEWPS